MSESKKRWESEINKDGLTPFLYLHDTKTLDNYGDESLEQILNDYEEKIIKLNHLFERSFDLIGDENQPAACILYAEYERI